MCTFKSYFSDLFFASLGPEPEIECLVHHTIPGINKLRRDL